MHGVERECWCDDDGLEPFSSQYLRCAGCGTLVSQVRAGGDAEGLGDSYGQGYWVSHQREQLGLPDIDQRARLDLPERCLYWLRTLLAYKLPPARTLELGCSHGAFVSLLRRAGLDAVGLELNAWVVDHAQRTFRIPVLQGSIEQHELPPQSFDAIILNDVLEHLLDPLRTMRCCVPLLKADGVLLIQTPSYPDPKTYEELEQEHHPFLKMLLPDEHLYLFSERSLRRLLASLGWPTAEFKPALFPYDMYAIVTQQPLPTAPPDAIVTALSVTPDARMVLALLDLDDRFLQQQARVAEQQSTIANITRKLEDLSADNRARLQLIFQHQTIEADQQRVIQDVTRKLEDLSADNNARLEILLQQQATITGQQAALAEQRATITGQQAALAEQQLALARQQKRTETLERNRVVRLLRYCRLLRS
jgi:2-polyprenyl-3-methyl-5-hydroxy-6-metoxy-1,4-benzoquinol methylase